jgi:Thioredoxin domain
MNLPIKLVGSPLCRRYQRMCQQALEAATRLGVEIQLQEVNDPKRLSQANPLNLPQLYIGETLVASRNPPKAKEIEQQIQKALKEISER